MELQYPDVNSALKTQYASFLILLPVSKDNNNSSMQIMNSSGQIVIAFVCTLMLVMLLS